MSEILAQICQQSNDSAAVAARLMTAARSTPVGAPTVRDRYLPFGKPDFGDEEIAEVARVMRSGWVGMGPETIAFEHDLSQACKARHVVTVNSCTSALFLSLLVHGVSPGDEVIVPSLTWISTANAARYLGATPVFCDVDPSTLAIGNLWAVTPPGGRGLHHIDFRDHRNFDDPLRYLTLDHATFEAIKQEPFGNFGTQLRISDFVRCFEAAGFVVTTVSPDPQRASAEYLAQLRPQLSPEFRDLPDAELNVLGGWVCVKRPA